TTTRRNGLSIHVFAGTTTEGGGRAVPSSDLENLLLGLVQAVADPPRANQIVVADGRPHRAGIVTGMHREMHVRLDRHRLVGADHRAFHHVVALAMGVEADLHFGAVLAHVLV